VHFEEHQQTNARQAIFSTSFFNFSPGGQGSALALDRIREILDLLGYDDSDDRSGGDIGPGLAADLREKVLPDVRGGIGKFCKGLNAAWVKQPPCRKFKK
jgi:hypothetical protein